MLMLRQTILNGYSLFPKTELKFRMNKELCDIIIENTPFRKTDYRNMTDFLFCEIFPHWKKYCDQYYYNDGPKMKDDETISKKQINAFDTILSEYVLDTVEGIDFNNYTWEEFKVAINDILFSKSSY